MFFKRNDEVEVPDWAQFFTKSEYKTFITEIDRYFKKSKIDYAINDDLIIVDENVFGSTNLGLTSLSQICKQNKQRNYKKIIRNHFDAMILSYNFEQKFDKIAHNFEKVRKFIGVRLYNIAYFPESSINLIIHKKFAGDIVAVLIFDLPYSIINVLKEHISSWNIPVDELFELGIQNIKKKYSIKVKSDKLEKFPIKFVYSDNFFTSNIVFDMENRPKLIGTYGSIVGIPNRDSVIFYPIENKQISSAVYPLIFTINGMFKDGPGSISNNLFWYYDNKFMHIPYKFENNKLGLSPPKSFIEIYDKLK